MFTKSAQPPQPQLTGTRSEAVHCAVVDGLDVEALVPYGFIARPNNSCDGSLAADFEVQCRNGPYASTAYQKPVGFRRHRRQDVD